MTATDHTTGIAAAPSMSPRGPWIRLLAWTVAISTGVDLAVMALVGVVIPPLVAGAVLSLVGIGLLARRPRAGIALLAAVSTLLLLTSAPSALAQLAHPESGIDFGHAAIHLGGRLVAIAAAVGAWRLASPVIGRRLGLLAGGLLSVTVLVGVIATVLATSRDPALPGDVTVVVRDFSFPAEVRVTRGDSVFVENADLTRHTFTVEGTDVSQQLPPGAGVRFGIDLDAGTYRLFCAVPGHESMQAALVVD